MCAPDWPLNRQSVTPPLRSIMHHTWTHRMPMRPCRRRRASPPGEQPPRTAVLDQVSRRFRITGQVQGVYFRHSTRLQALGLALRGFARNLPDGSVEVVAHGSSDAVEKLRQWLQRGPAMARVEAVRELELNDATSASATFEVL